MFTYQWDASMFSKVCTTNTSVTVPATMPVKSTQGAAVSAIAIRGSGNYSTDWNSYSLGYQNNTTVANMTTRGIKFGTGTTAASREDYTLEQPATMLTCSAAGVIPMIDDDNHMCALFTNTVRNNYSEAVTVTEVGYVGGICTSTASSGNGEVMALYWREVLSSPIVIPPMSCRTVTVRLTFG